MIPFNSHLRSAELAVLIESAEYFDSFQLGTVFANLALRILTNKTQKNQRCDADSDLRLIDRMTGVNEMTSKRELTVTIREIMRTVDRGSSAVYVDVLKEKRALKNRESYRRYPHLNNS